MASQAERDKILAEYMQAAENGDDDDEEDFHDDDSGSDSDCERFDEDDEEGDEDDGEYNGGETKPKEENYAILEGALHINDEGRLIYSGTWAMKNTILSSTTSSSSSKTTTAAGIDGSNEKEETSSSDKKKRKKKDKKKTKFRLKSKQILQSKTSKFDLANPIKTSQEQETAKDNNGSGNGNGNGSGNGSKETANQALSILCDGFFTTDETDTIQPYRKVKERDVQITFSPLSSSLGSESAESSNDKKNKFRVVGVGNNEFGAFALEGIYIPSTTTLEGNGDASSSQSLTCHKRYTPATTAATQSNTKRKRGGNQFEDSEDDYEISDDEGADYNEIIGLHEEAGMSVEQLRQKYYGGGADNNEDENKRRKIMDDEDDDCCGF